MGITQKSIKILWSTSGGRCAFVNCWERLCIHDAKEASPYTIGEMAHICGDKPGASRYDASQTDSQRDDYQNLILLCPTHHTLIDRKENETVYTVEILLAMKISHEKRILERLNEGPLATKQNIACAILSLLNENKQSWNHYGPQSEIARLQPYNESVYAVWLSERLSIIVPNNTNIAKNLKEHKDLFEASEKELISEFLMHERSYRQWVEDAIPYEAVKRFPIGFENLMRKLTDGGA